MTAATGTAINTSDFTICAQHPCGERTTTIDMSQADVIEGYGAYRHVLVCELELDRGLSSRGQSEAYRPVASWVIMADTAEDAYYEVLEAVMGGNSTFGYVVEIISTDAAGIHTVTSI